MVQVSLQEGLATQIIHGIFKDVFHKVAVRTGLHSWVGPSFARRARASHQIFVEVFNRGAVPGIRGKHPPRRKSLGRRSFAWGR